MPRHRERARLESGLRLDLNNLRREGFVVPGKGTFPRNICWRDAATGELIAFGSIHSDAQWPEEGGSLRVIRAAGARLFFLPPYSPDLNPIEQVFAKLKHFLRKAAERTAPATWRRIGTLLDDFSPDECANYFVNSGYASV